MKQFKKIDGDKVIFRIPKGAKVTVRPATDIDMGWERLVAPQTPFTHPKDGYDVIEISKPV